MSSTRIHNSLKLVTGPAVEPITVEQAKLSARIDGDAEDDEVEVMVTESREDLEAQTARAFIYQTWRLTLDKFPKGGIELRVCPVASVTSMTVINPAGQSEVVSTDVYQVDTDSEPGRIRLKPNQAWPDIDSCMNAITIVFVAGYGATAENVPANIKRAIKLSVGERFRNREISTSNRRTAEGDKAYQRLVKQIAWGAYP